MRRFRERPGSGILVAAVLFLFVYFFFPIVFVLPIELGIKHRILPEASRTFFEPAFAPIAWLYQHCTPYRALIDAEGGFFVIRGLIDEY